MAGALKYCTNSHKIKLPKKNLVSLQNIIIIIVILFAKKKRNTNSNKRRKKRPKKISKITNEKTLRF